MAATSMTAGRFDKCEICHRYITDKSPYYDLYHDTDKINPIFKSAPASQYLQPRSRYEAVKSKRDKRVRFYHDDCIKKEFNLKTISHTDQEISIEKSMLNKKLKFFDSEEAEFEESKD